MDDGDIFGPLARSILPLDGSAQLAQAIPSTEASPTLQPIGQVETLSGAVTVLHPDGTRDLLEAGDPIHQDDRIETGGDGSVGVTFVDASTLSLGANGTMVLDQFVFDPASREGQSSVSLLQGVFSFASGAIAKSDPDASIITTPVGTIGVRGTTGAGQAGPEGTENTLILVLDADGTLGEILWSTPGGVSILNQVNQFLTTTSAFQAPRVVVLTSDQASERFGSVLAGLPNPAETRFNFDATLPVGIRNDGGEDSPAPPEGEGPGQGADDPAAAGEEAARQSLDQGETPDQALDAAVGAVLTVDPEGGQEMGDAMRAIYLEALTRGLSPEEALALAVARAGLPENVPDLGARTGLGLADLLSLNDLSHGQGFANAFGKAFGYLDGGTDLGAIVSTLQTFQDRIARLTQMTEIATKTRLDRTTETTMTNTITTDSDTGPDTTEQLDDTTIASGRFTMTSGDDGVTGDSDNTVFIFNQSKNGGLGGTDTVSDIGGSDTILIQNPEKVVFAFGALNAGTRMVTWEGSVGDDVSTNAFTAGSAVQTVSISNEIESLYVTYNGQTLDFSKALSLSSSDHAWVLVGNANGTKFTLNDSSTVLSALFAGDGNDIVDVKNGSGHSLHGEGGDDVFWLHQGASIDVIGGGSGTDVVFSSKDAAALSVGSISNVEDLVRVGTSGADTLAPSGTLGGMAFTHVWGREGADTINTESGRLGVMYSNVDIDGNADTISNFTAGAGGDGLVFDNDILTRTGEFVSYSNSIDSNAGVVVYKNAMSGFSPTSAYDVASYLDGQGMSGLGTGQKIVFVVGDTSGDSAVWYWNDAGGNQDGIIDDGELTQLATLNDVDITTITENNIVISSDAELFQYQET
ncbi:MAG: FecR domain-containing protein [Rhodospirillum sp.]|nr:FecR domain-containing protein [Rhodospirillum sp.]MCF8489855.1 FecR domain-containing protein [Rhodospirillum sp.]MCF8499418.1 FecR domain-containing protein [Rhodospirillum sp.]